MPRADGRRKTPCAEVALRQSGDRVDVRGWIARSARRRFVVRDGTGQVTCVASSGDAVAGIPLESVVRVGGSVAWKGGEAVILAERIELLAAARLPADLARRGLDPKRATGWPHLDMRTSGLRARLGTMDGVMRSARAALHGMNFLEVLTPYLSPSTQEYGPGELFVRAAGAKRHDLVLAHSPQLYKQSLILGGVERYFQLARCFRTGASPASRGHLTEFTQIDLEMAHVTLDELVRVAERLVRRIFHDQGIVIETPFPRIRFGASEAEIPRSKRSSYSFWWSVDMPYFERLERRLVPMHHPFMAPRREDEALLAKAPERVRLDGFDLFCNGLELASGGLRASSPEVQRAVLAATGLGHAEIDRRFGWLLEALSHGTPPHGGMALGLERIGRLVCEVDDVRDVTAFPTRPDEALGAARAGRRTKA